MIAPGKPALGALYSPELRALHAVHAWQARTSALADCVDTFQRWLHLPDPAALLLTLATVVANRADGDPVWLLLVGPPGSGKTECLGPLTALADVHQAATLTEAALLSGTPKRDAKGAKGGLLREIGDFGILLAKDFGSVLSMHTETRAAALLAALREVYDGSWTRHVGTDGGRTLHWEGKVGLIAGCTPAIDRHHAVMGSMGERFALYRLPEVEADEQARRVLTHAGHEAQMRAELATAVTRLLDAAGPARSANYPQERLIRLATLAVRCRSAVERDSYTREIELIPESEAPARLALVLARIYAGLRTIGADNDTAWSILVKVALDSMPAIRRTTLEHLLAASGPLATPTIARNLGYPNSTIKRALEDLAAHGVIGVEHQSGKNQPDLWAPTVWTVERWGACRPEKPHGDSSLNTPLRIEEGNSGSQTRDGAA